MTSPHNLQIEIGKTFTAKQPSKALDGYDVVFRYAGAGNLQTADCSYDGTGYEVTVPVSTTAELNAGDYRYDFTAQKTDGEGVVTEAHTLSRGRLKVVDFVDQQYEKQWIYDALGKARQALVDFSDSADNSITTPDGLSAAFETRADLLDYIGYLESKLRQHELNEKYGEPPVFVDLGILRHA